MRMTEQTSSNKKGRILDSAAGLYRSINQSWHIRFFYFWYTVYINTNSYTFTPALADRLIGAQSSSVVAGGDTVTWCAVRSAWITANNRAATVCFTLPLNPQSPLRRTSYCIYFKTLYFRSNYYYVWTHDTELKCTLVPFLNYSCMLLMFT